MVKKPNVFIKNVWGYDPDDWPAIVFKTWEKRQRFLDEAEPGDLVLLKGTIGQTVNDEDENRLLAIAEVDFGRLFYSNEILKDEILKDPKYMRGKYFGWNYALEIKRVWIFEEKPKDDEVLVLKNLKEYNEKSEKGSVAVKITDEDRDKVLELKEKTAKQVRVGNIRRQEEDNADSDYSTKDRPTTGEQPETNKGYGITYALRFGDRNAWKIGHTQRRLYARIMEINLHVPYEILNEKWVEHKTEPWKSIQKAYEMEQEVLRLLSGMRTHGELVQCTEEELNKAWEEAKK